MYEMILNDKIWTKLLYPRTVVLIWQLWMLPINDAQNMRACETVRIQAIIITFPCPEDHSTNQLFPWHKFCFVDEIYVSGGGYPAYGFSFPMYVPLPVFKRLNYKSTGGISQGGIVANLIQFFWVLIWNFLYFAKLQLLLYVLGIKSWVFLY